MFGLETFFAFGCRQLFFSATASPGLGSFQVSELSGLVWKLGSSSSSNTFRNTSEFPSSFLPGIYPIMSAAHMHSRNWTSLHGYSETRKLGNWWGHWTYRFPSIQRNSETPIRSEWNRARIGVDGPGSYELPSLELVDLQFLDIPTRVHVRDAPFGVIERTDRGLWRGRRWRDQQAGFLRLDD